MLRAQSAPVSWFQFAITHLARLPSLVVLAN